ncbi:hypothetical protein BDZ88DRAFT_266531 [Geranomyces variabilis]|nr:hypothetical protein BDZ88DRAFT_266531 [Geranomyces variabilis]KAJ3134317.1 hypothetical protein HDU90_005183 [Geranomyces variabilis]
MLTLARVYSCYPYPPPLLLNNRLIAPPPPPPPHSSQYPTFQPRSSSLPRCNNGGGGGALGDALVAACLDGDVKRVRSLLVLGAPVNWHGTANELSEHHSTFTTFRAALPPSLPAHWTPLAAACAARTNPVALVRCLLAHGACVDERAVCVAVIAPTSSILLPLLLLIPKSATSLSSRPLPAPPTYPLALLLATTTNNISALSTLLTHSTLTKTSSTSLYPAETLATAARAAAATNHPSALRIILRAGGCGGGGGGEEKDASRLACLLTYPQHEIVTAARNGFWGVVRVLLDEVLDVGGASGEFREGDAKRHGDDASATGLMPPPPLRAVPTILPPAPGIELSWEDVMVDIG